MIWPSMDYWQLHAEGLSPAGAMSLFALVLIVLAVVVGWVWDHRG
jgi:hypothetical protein